MSAAMLEGWMKGQKLMAPSMKGSPVLYRNLEEALDVRRRDHALFVIRKNVRQDDDTIDFSSNDILALGASGSLRQEFLRELERHPYLPLGAGGSRMMDGNYDYLEMVEDEIARFHGAEQGLIVGSGFEANLAIFTAIPRSGDAIVYDELVHASTHDGMQQSQAACKVPFRHNNVDSFRDALVSVRDSQPLIRQGRRSVIIAVESVYSMDGDVCPLEELIEVAKETFVQRNAQFLVDEAHSTGVIGPMGAGLVCELGLEKDVAIRLHTFGKALASSGAIVLGNSTIKNALTNFARSVIYTTAPTFPVVCAVRSAYNLMRAAQTKASQENIQRLVKHFFIAIATDAIWKQATAQGVLNVPLSSEWQDMPALTHIIPIWTRQRYNYWLVFHLYMRKFSTVPVEFPVVPKGQGRIRIVFHANNTESQVESLVSAIGEWAQEMMEIEKDQGTRGTRLPRAARQVYAWMGNRAVDGSESG
ncbi:MAG: hypothetical protein L6R42_002333 [Xanthoria sp. 1 TBL-2021]|nr:MAG: hypothetical protein L6R42_002333 [Xanthoria sp. 1 TBL-2021]